MGRLSENAASFFSELSQEYFSQWRLYRLLSALISALAIIPAMIDYERSYDPTRGHEECKILPIGILNRFIIVGFSFLGLLMLIPYRIYYLKWLKNLPMTYKEYPPTHKVGVLEVMEMQRKRKWTDHILEDGTWFQIVLLLIMPIPGFEGTFSISQQILFTQTKVCYYWTELFYALMFLRLPNLAVASLNYGKFQSDLARATAEKYGVKINTAFSVKCYIGANAMFILVFFFLIPGVLMFGTLLRIFERPMLAFQDFDSLENSCWNIIITMTTVGYGDTFPASILGRTMVVFSIFWGGIILSLTFVTVGSVLQLKENERKAYNAIVMGREAACAINGAIVTAKHDSKNKNAWARIRTRLRGFLAMKSLDASNETFIVHATNNLSSKLRHSEAKAERIHLKLEKLLATL
jgi:hypothetical protein